MIKVKWDIAEAVVLIDAYMKAGETPEVSEDTLLLLADMYKKKATEYGIEYDEKFRNLTGLKMQLQCVRYVVTEGKEGMANASKVFYEAYDLFKNNRSTFDWIKDDFYHRYN